MTREEMFSTIMNAFKNLKYAYEAEDFPTEQFTDIDTLDEVIDFCNTEIERLNKSKVSKITLEKNFSKT